MAQRVSYYATNGLVDRMKGGPRLGNWDVLVSYAQDEVVRLLRKRIEERPALTFLPTWTIPDSSDIEGGPRTLVFQLQLGPPDLVLKTGPDPAVPMADMAFPLLGGYYASDDPTVMVPVPAGVTVVVTTRLDKLYGSTGNDPQVTGPVASLSSTSSSMGYIAFNFGDAFTRINVPDGVSMQFPEVIQLYVADHFRDTGRLDYHVTAISNDMAPGTSGPAAVTLRPSKFCLTISKPPASAGPSALCIWIALEGSSGGTSPDDGLALRGIRGEFLHPIPTGSQACIMFSHDTMARRLIIPSLTAANCTEVTAKTATGTNEDGITFTLRLPPNPTDWKGVDDKVNVGGLGFNDRTRHINAGTLYMNAPLAKFSLMTPRMYDPPTVGGKTRRPAAALQWTSDEMDVGWKLKLLGGAPAEHGNIRVKFDVYPTGDWVEQTDTSTGNKDLVLALAQGRLRSPQHYLVTTKPPNDKSMWQQFIGGSAAGAPGPGSIVLNMPNLSVGFKALNYFLVSNLLLPGDMSFVADKPMPDKGIDAGIAHPYDTLLTGRIESRHQSTNRTIVHAATRNEIAPSSGVEPQGIMSMHPSTHMSYTQHPIVSHVDRGTHDSPSEAVATSSTSDDSNTLSANPMDGVSGTSPDGEESSVVRPQPNPLAKRLVTELTTTEMTPLIEDLASAVFQEDQGLAVLSVLDGHGYGGLTEVELLSLYGLGKKEVAALDEELYPNLSPVSTSAHEQKGQRHKLMQLKSDEEDIPQVQSSRDDVPDVKSMLVIYATVYSIQKPEDAKGKRIIVYTTGSLLMLGTLIDDPPTDWFPKENPNVFTWEKDGNTYKLTFTLVAKNSGLSVQLEAVYTAKGADPVTYYAEAETTPDDPGITDAVKVAIGFGVWGGLISGFGFILTCVSLHLSRKNDKRARVDFKETQIELREKYRDAAAKATKEAADAVDWDRFKFEWLPKALVIATDKVAAEMGLNPSTADGKKGLASLTPEILNGDNYREAFKRRLAEMDGVVRMFFSYSTAQDVKMTLIQLHNMLPGAERDRILDGVEKIMAERVCAPISRGLDRPDGHGNRGYLTEAVSAALLARAHTAAGDIYSKTLADHQALVDKLRDLKGTRNALSGRLPNETEGQKQEREKALEELNKQIAEMMDEKMKLDLGGEFERKERERLDRQREKVEEKRDKALEGIKFPKK